MLAIFYRFLRYYIELLKRLKKILLILLFIVLSIPPVGYGLVWFFAKDLKAYAIEQINHKIDAKLEIGEIEISMLKQFPDIGLHLQQVKIINKPLMPAGNLLSVKDAYINFNLWDVITKNFQISNILLDSGNIDGFVDANGKYNYDIIKADSGKQDTKFWLKLNYIELKNISFKHRQNLLVTAFHINKLAATGTIKNNEIVFEERSDIDQLTIRNNNTSICENRQLKSHLNCNVNFDKELFSLQKSSIISGEFKSDITGNIYYGNESSIDMTVKGEEMKITSLASLLGISLSSNEYKSEGDIYIDCQLNGRTDKTNSPELKVNFGVKNGVLYKNKYQLKNINLKGEYHIPKNSNLEGGILNIPVLSANVNQSSVSGNLYLKGITNPIIETKLNARIDASDLQFLLNEKSKISGKLHADLNIKYHADKKKTEDNIKAEGKLECDNLSLSTSEHAFKDLNGLLRFNKNTIEIEQLSGYYNESDFDAKGKLVNWYGYLFNKEILDLKAKLSSKHFIYKSSFISDSTSSAFALPHRVEAHIKLDCKQFDYNQFTFTQAAATTQITEQYIKIKDITANAFGGFIIFESLDFKKIENGFLLDTKGNINQVSISNFFKSFNNFDQTVLTYQNIGGKATIKDLHALVYFDEKLNVLLKKIKVDSRLTIENGVLNNFEPALKLAKFIDVNELRNLKFSKLENDILIYDGIIHIPQMNIQSNAINLAISGQHDFDNNLDYYIKLKLNEVLFKKRNKPASNEFGELIDEGRRGIYLYLHMTGVPPDVKIVYDKKGLKKEASKNIKEEKEKVKELFKKEFKDVNDEKLNPKKDKPKEKEDVIDWDG